MPGRKHKRQDLRTWDPETGRQLTRRDGSPLTERLPARPGQGPASGIPAKGQEQFRTGEPEDPRVTTHGAKSPTIYAARAATLAEGLLAERPDLARYPEAVQAWATAEARCQLVREYEANAGGLLDGNGDPRSFAALATSLEKAAAAARDRLGLDPVAEAKLARDRASASLTTVNLAEMTAHGRAILEQRRAALAAESAATTSTEGRELAPGVTPPTPAAERDQDPHQVNSLGQLAAIADHQDQDQATELRQADDATTEEGPR
ncbi:hypothetical protein ACTQ49_11740 [Luteococcus sp. Sow4_B9]|uniref:hypothetical protein n=1 Tax=Luteococcus sp. Sow4_B9 TaxID=3438792 RepID=UPI003F9E2F61